MGCNSAAFEHTDTQAGCVFNTLQLVKKAPHVGVRSSWPQFGSTLQSDATKLGGKTCVGLVSGGHTTVCSLVGVAGLITAAVHPARKSADTIPSVRKRSK